MGCQKALFEWADSYDAKDWSRLRKCIAPNLKVDYSAFLNKEWEAMPADEFVQMTSSPHFLGNPLIKTQHFIGLGSYKKLTKSDIEGTVQMRVAHQKYKDSDFTEVAAKGHDHGTGTMWFKRVEGVWKFAGLKPNRRWAEYNMELIFSH